MRQFVCAIVAATLGICCGGKADSPGGTPADRGEVGSEPGEQGAPALDPPTPVAMTPRPIPYTPMTSDPPLLRGSRPVDPQDMKGAFGGSGYLERGVLGVLTEFCGDCHAGRGNAEGGIDYILNLERLVSEGWIIPLDSANSPMVQMMRARTMPPAGYLPEMLPSDMRLIEQYIDNPAFWPSPEPILDSDAGIPPSSSDAG